MAAATADYVIDSKTAAAAAAAEAEVADFAWGKGVEASGREKGSKGAPRGKGWGDGDGGLDVDWMIPGGQLFSVGLEMEVLEEPGVDMFQVRQGGVGGGAGWWVVSQAQSHVLCQAASISLKESGSMSLLNWIPGLIWLALIWLAQKEQQQQQY
jgi:hypothetical protein